MSLKEQLIKNKAQNLQNQFEVSTQQARLSYELGDEFDADIEVNYDYLYEPFIHEYADLQLKLDNGTSKSPAYDRQKVKEITDSVEVIKNALENVMSNTEIWSTAVIMAGNQGGIDLMGTPSSRYKAINILGDFLKGIIRIVAVDDDINKLAWEVYTTEGDFVERMFLSKINKLSETQNMFVSIPDVRAQNIDFKKTSNEIFETQKLGDEQALTGGVTESYRKLDKNGDLDLITKPVRGNIVQDFYTIDKEAIGNSLQFNTEMKAISSGILSDNDGAIAFNNNILSKVTDHFLTPSLALMPNEQEKFKEDYKTWFLEKEVGKIFPFGEARQKEQEVKQEEKEEAVALDKQAQEEMV